MADHQQQQILEAAQAILIAAATAAGSHVYLDHVDELLEADLPAIHVEGGDEDVSDETVGHPVLQQRQFNFSTSCIVSGAGYGKAARNLAAQIEVAFLTPASPVNGKAQSLRLRGSTVNKDGSGATVLFEVRQQWQAAYYTKGGIPDALA